MRRRSLLQASALAGLVPVLAGCANRMAAAGRAKVVVLGGGFGGATAAKYIRLLSDHSIDVMLIEPNRLFLSCPMSNLVVGGIAPMQSITLSYEGLRRRHGVDVVHEWATAIDPSLKTVRLASGQAMRYDKLVLSPGIDLMFDEVEGLRQAQRGGRILQAWQAGAETAALFQQLQAMRDGGVFAITVPEVPFRCPPGPYERASLVATYFKKHKPKSKVLILDANQDVASKAAMFKKAWADLYPDMLEYRHDHQAVGVNADTLTVKFEVHDDVRADVLNVLPPMRAGALAVQTGLANANGRWCHVNYQTFESSIAQDIHVLGDSIQVAPLMPKSGHMANNQAKVAAAAIVAELKGLEINPKPMLLNTCYSFVNEHEAVHVDSVHEYVAAERTFKTVAGSGGASAFRSELEGRLAYSWARHIWADTFE